MLPLLLCCCKNFVYFFFLPFAQLPNPIAPSPNTFDHCVSPSSQSLMQMFSGTLNRTNPGAVVLAVLSVQSKLTLPGGNRPIRIRIRFPYPTSASSLSLSFVVCFVRVWVCGWVGLCFKAILFMQRHVLSGAHWALALALLNRISHANLHVPLVLGPGPVRCLHLIIKI